jgi:hypothetical protein
MLFQRKLQKPVRRHLLNRFISCRCGDLKWIIFLLFLLFFPYQGYSQSFRGSISSELYAYKDRDTSHIRPYLRLRANLIAWQSTKGRLLEFGTNLRWTTDFKTKLISDPQLYIYNLYAHLAGLPANSDIYLGRQFVYNGFGSALIDGLRFKYNFTKKYQIDLFGGNAVSGLEPKKIRSFSKSGMAGARFSYKPTQQMQIGLGWIYRKIDGLAAVNRLGLDIDQSTGRWRLFGRTTYNMSWIRLGEVTSRVSYSGGPWYWSGEFNWREPSVSDATIFSILDFKRYQIVRSTIRRTIWRDLGITAELFTRLQSGDDSYITGLGISSGSYGLSWRYQTGPDGHSNGVNGFIAVRISSNWEVYGNGTISRYKVQEEQSIQNDDYASHLGLAWHMKSGLMAAIEGQFARNAVATSQSRLYFRLTKNFSASLKSLKGKP